MRFRLLSSVVPVLLASNASAVPLNPNAFTSLGTLNVAGGGASCYTGFTPRLVTNSGTYTGAIVSQGAGLPEIAVFTFDSISLSEGLQLHVSGPRAVAFLSKSDFSITGETAIVLRLTLFEAPPGSVTTGVGGAGPATGGGGGGGSFGGTGGNGAGTPGGLPGVTYGNLLQSLVGGSPGGNAARLHPDDGSGKGGGGGGALELGAANSLHIGASAYLEVDGAPGHSPFPALGSGGGGSGGAILVHANQVSLAGTAPTLFARGAFSNPGEEPTTTTGGGGGGGGRIAVHVGTLLVGTTPIGLNADVSGGAGLGGGQAGAPGRTLLAAGSAIVPAGQRFELDSPGPGYDDFVAEQLTIQAGGKVTSRSDITQNGAWNVQAGGALETDGHYSLGANRLLLLSGGKVNANGFVMGADSTLRGHGTIASRLTSNGLSNARIQIDPGGSLMAGDASLTDGFDFDGELVIDSRSTAPASMVVHDANSASIGTTFVGAFGTLSATNGLSLRTGRTLTAGDSATIDGAFINNGTVAGPAGTPVRFAGAVAGRGSYSGKVRFDSTVSLSGAAPLSGVQVQAEHVQFAPSAQLEIDLFGVAPTAFDRIQATGLVNVAGTLKLMFVSDFYTPALGHSHRIVSAGALIGRFSSIQGVVINSTRRFAVLYDQTGVTAQAAIPGDADLNGIVNFDDLLILAQEYGGSSQTWVTGDFDGTGSTDFEDLLVLAQHYSGATELEPGLFGSTFHADWTLARSLVPEPSLAITGVLLAGIRRRR